MDRKNGWLDGWKDENNRRMVGWMDEYKIISIKIDEWLGRVKI